MLQLSSDSMQFWLALCALHHKHVCVNINRSSSYWMLPNTIAAIDLGQPNS